MNIAHTDIYCVVYQVKDTIFWKQITTIGQFFLATWLLFIKSKIQFFESKSQPFKVFCPRGFSCLSSQRYNFLKANHNAIRYWFHAHIVVYQVKDTIFWKQITTGVFQWYTQRKLFIKSKIQFFESKSQLHAVWIINSRVVYQVKDTIFWKQITTTNGPTSYLLSCLSSQRYNFLKANHNQNDMLALVRNVVYQVKDTIFWKQITTYRYRVLFLLLLFIKSKIQFFESKSQRCSEPIVGGLCCLSSQRYNFLKANHNKWTPWIIRLEVVYQVKDTIFWKQITTAPNGMILDPLLFIKSKIQFFESKSQLKTYTMKKENSCLSSQRYNFLKANHNSVVQRCKINCVVYQVKDTIFWKQITTGIIVSNLWGLLFIKSKIQFFESKSQPLR